MPPPRRRKLNSFFVDTKTTCFLCLEDIPRGSPPPSHPPLDSVIKLECDDDLEILNEFIANEEKESVEEKSLKTISLRSICKLLNIDAENLIRRKMPADTPTKMEAKLWNTDFVVVLCDDCHTTTTQLSKLCMELELLQMNVDHSLRGFLGILKKSNANPELMESLQAKVDQLDQFQISLVEGIREETRSKCLHHFENSMPRVHLNSDLPIAPPPSVLSEVFSKVPHFRTDTNKFLCSMCPPNGGEFSEQHSLREHYFLSHPDYFFLPVKFPGLCETQFQKICSHLMQTEVFASEKAIQEDLNLLNGDVTFSCQHCTKPFYDYSSSAFSQHVIQTHYETLSSKLIDLQRKNPLLEEDDLPQIPELQCHKCKVKFSMKRGLHRHQKENEACRPSKEQQMTSKKRLRCLDCNKNAFNSLFSLKRHKQSSCPALSWKCSDCETHFSNKGNLWRHRKLCPVASNGKDARVRKSDFRCPRCNVACKNQRILKRHVKKWHKTRKSYSEKRFKCEHCRRVFFSCFVLDNHQKSNCPNAKAAAMQQQSEQIAIAEVFDNVVGGQGIEDEVEIIKEEGEVIDDHVEIIEEEGEGIDDHVEITEEEVEVIEEDENDMKQESFSISNIQVVETPQVQISSYPEDHENDMEEVNDDLYLASHIW